MSSSTSPARARASDAVSAPTRSSSCVSRQRFTAASRAEVSTAAIDESTQVTPAAAASATREYGAAGVVTSGKASASTFGSVPHGANRERKYSPGAAASTVMMKKSR